jgi:hypothetical protein
MRESVRDEEQGLGAPDPIGVHYDVLGGIGERMRGGILGIEVRKQYGNGIIWASLSKKRKGYFAHELDWYILEEDDIRQFEIDSQAWLLKIKEEYGVKCERSELTEEELRQYKSMWRRGRMPVLKD